MALVNAAAGIDIPKVQPFNPLETAAQVLGLQSAKQNLVNQRLQQARLQKDQAAQDRLSQLLSVKPDATADEMLQVAGPSAIPVIKEHLANQAADIQNKQNLIARHKDYLNELGSTARNLLTIPDLGQRQQVFKQSLDQWRQLGLINDQDYQQALNTPHTDDQLKQLMAGTPAYQAQLSDAEKKLNDAAERKAKESAALASEASAKASEARAMASNAEAEERGHDKKIAEYTDDQGRKVLVMQPSKGKLYTAVQGKEGAPPTQLRQAMTPEAFAQQLQLEKLKLANQNDIPPLNFIKESTANGKDYIDSSKVEPKTLNALQNAAGKAGVPVVDKDTAVGLRDAASVKAAQQTMMDLLNGRLADNPLSRLFAAPANKLKQIGQIDPNLAVTGTFVGPAIQSLRAMAGARNFRITQSEINAAIDNFVPKATDTIDVAKKKIQTIDKFLADKEAIALGNRSSNGGQRPPLSSFESK
jgi:hypothetical protein